MEITTLGAIISIILSFIAIAVAIIQTFISRSQLVQAKTTQSETERILEQIKEKVLRVENISDETRKDIKEQVAKLLDKQDENFKTLLNAPKENNQNEMMMTFLPKIMENPTMFDQLIKMANMR